MIEEPKTSDVKEISQLISSCVKSCIIAGIEDLQNIENSSIKASLHCLEGGTKGAHLVYRKHNAIHGIIFIKDYWNLVSLFVAPESQRNGIATRLVDEALIICRELSSKNYLALNSSSYASSFYREFGFEPSGDPIDLPGGCIPYVLYY